MTNNPKTDLHGNCLECGRLISPRESDVLKALLILGNAGYTSVYLKGNGLVLLSPDAHAGQYAEDNTCDRLLKAIGYYRERCS